MMEEETGTHLGPDEAALIVDAAGELSLLLPEYPEDQPVPPMVLLLAAVARKAASDPAWVEALIEQTFGGDA